MKDNQKKVESERNIIIRFFKKLLDPTQNTSIKSLAMLCAIVISIGLTICLGYSMVLDAKIDGILNMNLVDAGIFVTCIGSFMSLASIPKVLIDRIGAKGKILNLSNETNIENEDAEA